MTVRFWKDGEKFTERELDSYWNGREEEQDRIVQLLTDIKGQFDQFIEARPDRKDILIYNTISRTYQSAVNAIKGETE